VKKKIDNTEYEIIPIPPYLSPYNARISELLQTKSKNFQEAEEISKEIKQHMEKLLSETVKPNPPIEHQTAVYNALIDITNATIKQAEFFRKNKGLNPTKSGTVSINST
jgi:hypothetical protein